MDWRAFILKWNNERPLDYWFRKKHNIIWGSQQHRDLDIFSIRFEYEEFKLMEEFAKEREEMKARKRRFLETGEFLEKQNIIYTQEELESAFDAININDLNVGINGKE